MHGRAEHDVEMPLSRLPANNGQRVRPRSVGAARRVSINSRTTALSFHPEPGAECGSRIAGGEFEGGESQFVGIVAGSLDDPSWFHPQMEIFVSDAQPWDRMDPAIPKFEQYPPTPRKE